MIYSSSDSSFDDRVMREVAIDNRTTPTKREQTW